MGHIIGISMTDSLTQMDLGVGSFVFSSGLVSARLPNTSIPRQIWNAFRSSFLILLLGVVRMVLTKKVDYQVSPMS
jgi:hypothetical protein